MVCLKARMTKDNALFLKITKHIYKWGNKKLVKLTQSAYISLVLSINSSRARSSDFKLNIKGNTFLNITRFGGISVFVCV